MGHFAQENQTLKSQYNDLYNNFTCLQNEMEILQKEVKELQKVHGDKDATHAKVVHFLQSKNADLNRELVHKTMQQNHATDDPMGPHPIESSGIHPIPIKKSTDEGQTEHPDEAKCLYPYGPYPYRPYPYGPYPYGPYHYGPYPYEPYDHYPSIDSPLYNPLYESLK